MRLYYLSFQRGPPSNVVAEDEILVSPTIVNDLREEVYQPDGDVGPLVLHLGWVARVRGQWSLVSLAADITWEGPFTAYKACQVKVPSTGHLEDSDTIRLALWTRQEQTLLATSKVPHKRRRIEDKKKQEWIFDLETCSTLCHQGVTFLPVLSGPISVHRKTSGKINPEKSSNTSRLFRLGAEDCIIELCEESGYELDKVCKQSKRT
jgi:hypothetical protein